MTANRLIFILIASAVIAYSVQWISIENQHQKIRQLTDIACDLVEARAQAGSTRDVHDQLYSFWHKNSPSLHVDVLVKRGDKEVGSRSSLNQKNQFVQTCQIENRPDYEISFQFDDNKILSLSLLEKFAATFIVLLTASIFVLFFLRTVRELWSGQVLREISISLGLEPEPREKSNWLSRALAKIFLNSASSLKPAIENLQLSLSDRQSELILSKVLVLKLEEERLRADQFANVVTMVRHDLKGPLSSLKIITSGIRELPEESAALQQTIVSVEKIISDLDQSKNLSRSTNQAELKLEIVEVAIQEIVNEKAGTLANLNNIKIDFEYNPYVLSPVLCEPNHLRRMVANLLQNAIEASPKGSIIRLGVRHELGQVLIEVADQGGGIAPEILPKLFERGATFGKINGTGEGLSFIKAKADSFGGSVKVVETSNKGTTFQLQLPLASTKAHFQALPNEEACKQLAILDDEIEFQKFAWSKKPGQREYFNLPHAFLSWIEDAPEAGRFSYLVDLHLRDVVTGLDVLRTVRSDRKSYLATSDYLNIEALELSESLNVCIIPKTLLFSLCGDERI